MYFSILILSYFTKRLANHGLVECSTVSYLSFWMGLLCIMVKGPYYYVLVICHVTICLLVTSAIYIKFTIKLTLPFLNAVSKPLNWFWTTKSLFFYLISRLLKLHCQTFKLLVLGLKPGSAFAICTKVH